MNEPSKQTFDTLIATLDTWAISLGQEVRTIKRKFRRNGARIKPPGETYNAKEIFDGLTGDERIERLRIHRARATIEEAEARKVSEQSIDREGVREFINQTFRPIREDVLSLPGLLAAKCNPDNPELARTVLTDWTDQFITRRRAFKPH